MTWLLQSRMHCPRLLRLKSMYLFLRRLFCYLRKNHLFPQQSRLEFVPFDRLMMVAVRPDAQRPPGQMLDEP